MAVGANIKKRRYELRMSQQDLANALGYKTRSTIAKIESGENDVTQKKLQKFAQVLDTTVEALITGNFSAIASSLSAPFSAICPSVGTSKRQKTVAVILAGGKSIRNHQNIPNQFINILGKPVIVYILEAYQAHPAIDDVYVVCLKGWEKIVTAYAEQYNISKLRGLIPAAASGILSVKNGLEAVREKYDENDIIIFQESTRPMVNADMISQLLQACFETGSANICQSMKDYVQFSYVNGKAHYVDRNTVVDLQSPFQKAAAENHALTESCCVMLMYNLGFNISFIEGSVNNLKIIRQEDITIITSLLKSL